MSKLPTLREGELEQIRKKHPERIPVVVTRSAQCDKQTPDLKRHKFLVPNQFVFGDLIHTVRKWLTIAPEQSLFLFVTPPEKKNEFIPAPSSLLTEIHDTFRHRNGVLYVVYTLENTFGGDILLPFGLLTATP
jgi:GABA(A) receptor-associated protein